jgi:hypothetical protein
MKMLLGIILLLFALGAATESANAQSKSKKGKKSVKSTAPKKKQGIDGATDTVLEEQKVTIKLETPKVTFVVDRLYPDVKVDFNRFGDLTELIDADAQRAINRSKTEERPEPISRRDITRRIDK